MEPDNRPRVIRETPIAGGRFIQLKTLEWRDAEGATRLWESAERVADAGAVLVIARLLPSRRVILISQFRPPARRELIEFPAGLVDAGETPETAAVRELREETGYSASSVVMYPAAYTTPGLSSERVDIALVEVDEEQPENRRPQTAFDAGESIVTHLVEEDKLGEFYRDAVARGVGFDSKVAVFILSRFP